MTVSLRDRSDRKTADQLIVAIRALASARHMTEIVDIVRHAARELAHADGATFVMREGPYCHYVDEDAIAPLWRGQRFPLEACISGWAMLHHEAVAIPDIYVDDRIPQDAYRPTFVRSLVMTPVRTSDPIAAIGTYWADNHRATSYELEALQALADSTAVAIESVRLLDQLEQRVEERTEQLAAANRDLNVFAQLAAHDLRTPLLTASAYVELALRLGKGTLSDEVLEALGEARSAHERMGELIRAILDYSTMAQAELWEEPVALDEVVEHVRADLSAVIDERHATVEVAGRLPVAYGNAPLLERVVQNLVSNAIAYGDENAPRVIIFGARHLDGSTSLTVTDNGPGVPESERDRIFTMFTRGAAGSRAGGFGLGLALVARVVERHHGSVEVSDGPMGGASFTITLPAGPDVD